MYDVITIGSATRDVFLRSHALQLHKAKNIPGLIEACFPFGAKINVEELTVETGGGATNNAVTFSRMGKLRTAALARVGLDSAGDDVVRALKRDHVATALMQRTAREQTAYSTILLSGAAERTILVHRGASAKIESAKIPWAKLKARLFYVSSLSGDLALLRKILDHAAKTETAVYMNPGGGELRHGMKKLAPLFARLDLLIMNRDEAAQLTGKKRSDTKALIRALQRTSAHAVMTDGPGGAYAITQSGSFYMPVLPATTINLTGAGDAFGSAFAVGLIKYHDIKVALALGTMNATSVVQHTGAKVGIIRRMPTIKEIGRVRATTKQLPY